MYNKADKYSTLPVVYILSFVFTAANIIILF